MSYRLARLERALCRTFKDSIDGKRWLLEAEALVRKPGQSPLVYAFSKLNLCNKSPTPLSDDQKIRWVSKGIESLAYKLAISQSAPVTTGALIALIR